jgi:hypothetical protein
MHALFQCHHAQRLTLESCALLRAALLSNALSAQSLRLLCWRLTLLPRLTRSAGPRLCCRSQSQVPISLQSAGLVLGSAPHASRIPLVGSLEAVCIAPTAPQACSEAVNGVRGHILRPPNDCAAGKARLWKAQLRWALPGAREEAVLTAFLQPSADRPVSSKLLGCGYWSLARALGRCRLVVWAGSPRPSMRPWPPSSARE